MLEGKEKRVTGREQILSLVLPLLFVWFISDHKTDIPDNLQIIIGAVAAAAVTWIISCTKNDEKKRMFIGRKRWLLIPIVSSLFITAANQASFILNGIYYFYFLNQLLANIIIFILCLYLYENRPHVYRKSVRILSWVIWCFAIAALLIGPTWPEGFTPGVYYRAGGSHRLAFPYYNPIPAGTIWVIALWLPLLKSRKKSAVLKAAVYLPAIYLSMERNAWLAAGVSILLFIISYRREIASAARKIPRWIIIVVPVAIICAIIAVFHITSLSSSFWNRLFSGNYWIRIEHAGFIVKSFFTQNFFFIAFGKGAGSLGTFLRSSGMTALTGYDCADNTFLSLMYEYGLVMLVSFICVVLRAFVFAIKGRNVDAFTHQLSIAAAGACVTAGFYDIQFSASPSLMLIICLIPSVINPVSLGRRGVNT